MNLLITGAWQDAGKYTVEIESLGHKVYFMQWEKDPLPVAPELIEGVICNGLFLYHPLSSFPNLRFIQLTSAGFDRVDMDEIRHRNIEIHNAKGVYSVPMAEFAVACVLDRFKHLEEFHEQQKRREWKKLREITELAGKRVVIVGCGDVGCKCAKRFKAFDAEVVGVNIIPVDDPNFDRIVGLDELDAEISSADVVVVSIALVDETCGLVKANKIKGLLVNISRGAVVDTDGIGDAVLDVFETEPLDPSDPLWEKAFITPHNSFVGEGNGKRLYEVIMENLK